MTDRGKAEAALHAASPAVRGKGSAAPSWRNGTAPAPRMAAERGAKDAEKGNGK